MSDFSDIKFTETLSKKGKLLYVVNGFKFKFQKSLTHGIDRYSCTTRECLCFLKIDSDKNIVGANLDHKHEGPTEDDLHKNKIDNYFKTNSEEKSYRELRKCNVDDKYMQSTCMDLIKVHKHHLY